MNNPELYKIGLNYSCFTFKLFTMYLMYGLLQSTMIFILAFVMINNRDMQPGGLNMGLWVTGHFVFGMCICVANLVILFRYHNYTGWGEWCSIGMYLNFFTFLYWQNFFLSLEQTYYIFATLMQQPILWSQFLAICTITAAFELGYHYHNRLKDLDEEYNRELELQAAK